MLGILSAIVFVIGDIPYIRDTRAGKTKPQRVTWGIVLLLNAIAVANQYASGGRNSVLLPLTAVFVVGCIFLLSIKHGVGGHSKLDIAVLVTAGIGILAWLLFDDPHLSILANFIVAFAALTPTFIKAWKYPETETITAYSFGAISTLLAAISVGEMNFWLLLLPLQACVMQATLVLILSRQRPPIIS